jgi:hypothetical protein
MKPILHRDRGIGLPLGNLWLGEQFARIYDSIRQSMGLKSGGARLDGASLPPTMILAVEPDEEEEFGSYGGHSSSGGGGWMR